MPIKRIVCLANSRKPGGRCVAGLVVEAAGLGGWLRPISARPGQEVSRDERRYGSGEEPQLLDIVELSLANHQPEEHQRENWLLTTGRRWRKLGRLAAGDLAPRAEPSPLWLNGNQTRAGMNNRIPAAQAGELDGSLKLIQVDGLRLKVFRPGQDFDDDRPVAQARFEFGEDEYWIRVTDPVIQRVYFERGDGAYDLGASYLTVSLTKPYKGFIYKLVAGVIQRDEE